MTFGECLTISSLGFESQEFNSILLTKIDNMNFIEIFININFYV